jgi:hypothetical protein
LAKGKPFSKFELLLRGMKDLQNVDVVIASKLIDDAVMAVNDLSKVIAVVLGDLASSPGLIR